MWVRTDISKLMDGALWGEPSLLAIRQKLRARLLAPLDDFVRVESARLALDEPARPEPPTLDTPEYSGTLRISGIVEAPYKACAEGGVIVRGGKKRYVVLKTRTTDYRGGRAMLYATPNQAMGTMSLDNDDNAQVFDPGGRGIISRRPAQASRGDHRLVVGLGRKLGRTRGSIG